MLTLLALLVVGDVPDAGPVAPAPVSCRTVNDCWLAPDGKAIPRPAKFKWRAIPRGDCGKNLLWLRHELTCTENQCVSRNRSDMC
jgi:hypothetical protein